MCHNRAPSPAVSTNYSNQHHGGGVEGGGSGTYPAMNPQCQKCQLSVLHNTLPLQVERAYREAGSRQTVSKHFLMGLGGGWGHPTSNLPRSPLPPPRILSPSCA